MWAVGDGAVATSGDDQVAARIEREGLDHFLYLGDVYDTGTAQEYATRYDPSYGRFKAISSPTPGNHEWANRATGYDPYWGALAPQNGGGHWYSLDLGGWHLVSLSSQEPADEGSAQLAWLRRDLAAHPGRCTIAFWHKPRYSAGRHGDNAATEGAWAALSGHAVAVLSGHDHDYQRLAPNRGIVQFVVGTGGAPSYPVNTSDPRLRAWAAPSWQSCGRATGSATAPGCEPCGAGWSVAPGRFASSFRAGSTSGCGSARSWLAGGVAGASACHTALLAAAGA